MVFHAKSDSYKIKFNCFFGSDYSGETSAITYFDQITCKPVEFKKAVSYINKNPQVFDAWPDDVFNN